MPVDLKSAALIAVDVQNDFCPPYRSAGGREHGAGALAVAGGDAVVGPLNRAAARFARSGRPVIATADWHPEGHISFASSHGEKDGGDILWPDHCVAGTEGAAFHEDFDLRPVTLILHKGCRRTMDSYSAFFENDQTSSTGLAGYAATLGIKTVVVGGLAADYCVYYTVMDALRLGLEVYLLEDAIRSVDSGTGEAALRAMKEAGVPFIRSGDL